MFVNLPIGTYTLTYTADGYQAQKTPHLTVEADRTATLNVSLKVGQASNHRGSGSRAADERRRHH